LVGSLLLSSLAKFLNFVKRSKGLVAVDGGRLQRIR
jgi:hypothetical protein